MEYCKIGFRFKPSHNEKHYLMSRTGEEYSTTWTRNPAEAGKVPIDKIYIGMKWVRDSLEKDNFGRDYGYSYCGFVELSDGTTTTYLWCL